MTLQELRTEAAKLTPPPRHPTIGRVLDYLMYDDNQISVANLKTLYAALCVGAHGWHKAREDDPYLHYGAWMRLADAAYELLTSNENTAPSCADIELNYHKPKETK